MKIEFRNVSFRYPSAQELALDDVSFCIQPGEVSLSFLMPTLRRISSS
jgi:ABC-type multidrug transport system fused ATPase/permease subunit